MFCKIQNNGVCPVDRFKVLGLTTSRKDVDKIGQFGSGAKHAIFTLLRCKLDFVIFSGSSKIKFFTKTKHSEGHEYQQIFIDVNGEVEALNVALDFGEIDWKSSVDMAMRELIANAIDASQSIDDVLITITTGSPSATEGKTTIYIEASEEVKQYIADLNHRFLHFESSVEPGVIMKDTYDKVRFYHKGVFVKFGTYNSLFDYNFGDEIKIDESRNLDSVSCEHIVAQYLSTDKKYLKKVFQLLRTSDKYYETELYSYWLKDAARRNSATWKIAWEEQFGEKNLACGIKDGIVANRAIEKGYGVILIENASWLDAIYAAGINNPISVLSDVDESGNQLLPATPIIYATLDKVWAWFEDVDMIGQKERPNVVMFQSAGTTSRNKCGYVKDNTIYINQEYQTSDQTMVEEIAHYLSDAMDETREFQDFLIEYMVRKSR